MWELCQEAAGPAAPDGTGEPISNGGTGSPRSARSAGRPDMGSGSISAVATVITPSNLMNNTSTTGLSQVTGRRDVAIWVGRWWNRFVIHHSRPSCRPTREPIISLDPNRPNSTGTAAAEKRW